MPRRDDEERPRLVQLHEAVYVFSTAERRLVERHKRAGPRRLSPSRVMALNVLLREKEALAGTLAKEAALAPNSITPMIEQMEVTGLINRRRDAADGRKWWLSLTDKGRAELAEMQDEWDRQFADAFAGVPDRDLAAACRVLGRLASMFDGYNPPGVT